MSARDVELVRALQPSPQTNLIDLFGELDESSTQAAEVFAEDFVCIQHGLDEQPRTGLRGLREGWRNWLAPWESYRTEIEDVRDGGDCVLVLTRDFARRPGMDSEVEMVAAAVWTVRDGKVTQIEFFPDRGDAYAAAGLA
jgi:ketosteroid isomerase-like protein